MPSANIDLKDNVRDTVNSSGTGALVLAGSAFPGYRPVASAYADGALVPYHVYTPDHAIWETGYGAYDAALGQISRSVILANSAGTLVAISLPAGTKFLVAALVSKAVKPVIQSVADFYVNASTGSDSNSGWSSGKALLTTGALESAISELDLGRYAVNAHIADGDYTVGGNPYASVFSVINREVGDASGTVALGGVSLIGNTVTPGNVLWPYTYCYNAGLNVSGLYLTELDTDFKALVALDNCDFSALFTYNGGETVLKAGMTQKFNTSFALYCDGPGAHINVTAGISYSGSALVTGRFAAAYNQGCIRFNGSSGGVTAVGGATRTGNRFTATQGGRIITDTFLGDLSYFPGNAAGSIILGGAYDSYVNDAYVPGLPTVAGLPSTALLQTNSYGTRIMVTDASGTIVPGAVPAGGGTQYAQVVLSSAGWRYL